MITVLAILTLLAVEAAAVYWVLSLRIRQTHRRVKSVWNEADEQIKALHPPIERVVAAISTRAPEVRGSVEVVLGALARARGIPKLEIDERGLAEAEVHRAFASLQALAAAGSARSGDDEIGKLETEIAVGQGRLLQTTRRYNALARSLNTLRNTFPGNRITVRHRIPAAKYLHFDADSELGGRPRLPVHFGEA